MLRLTEIILPLSTSQDDIENTLRAAACSRLGIAPEALRALTIFRRSYDARKRSAITLTYSVDVEVADEAAVLKRVAGLRTVMPTPPMEYQYVGHAPADLPESRRPVVIGFGPCGLFAALILAQMGFRPIILERGRVVRERTKDTWGLWRKNILQPESNVQFGEGGAGTFSDGKLSTQVKDPKHYGRKVLQEFVAADAPPEILYVSKPHIGTFRLVKMIEQMRAQIAALGGEFRFESRVDDIEIEDGRVRGVRLAGGEFIAASHVVLAVGHSARDTFRMLHKRGVFMEAKPFSLGFRIEHPQSVIDRARFGPSAGHPVLGAADYKLVHHAGNGRAVYSFCMCPGGTVVAAASEPGGVVTNGMSQYSRNERNANAGIVVGIEPKDFPGIEDSPLAGIDFQRHWEKRAYELGGWRLQRAGAVGGRLPGGPAVDRPGQRHAVVQAGRDAHRPVVKPAGLRHRRHPRSPSGVRTPDQGLFHARRGADRRRDAHLVAAAHYAPRRFPEHEHPRAVPGGRGRGLRRRHHVGRHRRHESGRGGGAASAGPRRHHRRQSARSQRRLLS